MPTRPSGAPAGRRREKAPAPPCGSGDLAVTVLWQQEGSGLRGQVIARNISSRACLIGGKPAVLPLGLDGTPLPVSTLQTLEMMMPGYVVVQPGQRAVARLSWSEWRGAQASDRAIVSWDDGSAVADVHGPAQPAKTDGRAANLSSSWFRLLD